MTIGFKFKQNFLLYFILSIGIFQYQTFSFSLETINLLTEEKPPNNFEGPNKKTIGISTEIIEEIFKSANIKYKIEILPWARAYDTALKSKNTGLFSLARTPERENLFHWIGPIIKNDWVFFSRGNSKIKINSLNDAQKYSIGVYNQSALANFLIENGFKYNENLDISKEEKYNPIKLEKNRIDLWATGLLVGLYSAKLLETKFKPIYTIKETELYLAFNKETNEELLKQLKSTYNKIKNDKKIIKIQKKYGYYKNN